jgi:hypothetical protein
MKEPKRLRNEDFLEAVSRSVLRAIEGGTAVGVPVLRVPVTTGAYLPPDFPLGNGGTVVIKV